MTKIKGRRNDKRNVKRTSSTHLDNADVMQTISNASVTDLFREKLYVDFL